MKDLCHCDATFVVYSVGKITDRIRDIQGSLKLTSTFAPCRHDQDCRERIQAVHRDGLAVDPGNGHPDLRKGVLRLPLTENVRYPRHGHGDWPQRLCRLQLALPGGAAQNRGHRVRYEDQSGAGEILGRSEMVPVSNNLG